MPHSARYGRVRRDGGLACDGFRDYRRAGRWCGRRSCRPALRPRAIMVAMRASISTSGMRMRTGGGFGDGLAGAAADRRCGCGAGCCRGTSALPPHLAEAFRGRRRQVALAQPGAHRADIHGRRQAADPACRRRRGPSPRPSGRPVRTGADGSSARRRRGTPVSRGGSASRASRSS